MKMLLNSKTLYGTALILAMLTGSMVASATIAQAQSSSAAQAKAGVKLTSNALIERTETDKSGAEKTVLKTPAQVSVVPGDRVVFVLDYVNEGTAGATGFRATNPMPAAIKFISAREDWAEVSVDGGANWGKLSALTVTSGTPAVSRAATAEDVTHVRWVFPEEIAAGKKGSLSYTGVVK
jgi:hypothetical protein